ncbi:MAG: hypothetical protein MMC33_008968, partial [Icmadophila ericetorum]|nr:hypothetical protein [Icmadophila ericetorum]
VGNEGNIYTLGMLPLSSPSTVTLASDILDTGYVDDFMDPSLEWSKWEEPDVSPTSTDEYVFERLPRDLYSNFQQMLEVNNKQIDGKWMTRSRIVSRHCNVVGRFEDDSLDGEVLGKDVQGERRSSCSWCYKYIPAKDEKILA